MKLSKFSKISPNELVAMNDSQLEFELKGLQDQKNILKNMIDDLDTEIIGIREELRKRRTKRIEDAQMLIDEF